MSEPVRVKRIEVKGLFGLYDHTIDLKMEDRVTILHGPNGVGKTALLRLVKAALETDPAGLSARPFDQLRLELSDGRGVEIWPRRDDQKYNWPPYLFQYNATENGQIVDENRNQRFTIGSTFPQVEIPRWLKELLLQLPVRLVETQRLLVGDTHPSPTIDWIAKDLAARIADCLARYANESQEMSRTFLQRVLRTNGSAPSPEEIRVRVRAVQAEMERLSALGLLRAGNEGQSPPVTDQEIEGADSGRLAMLTQYVADQEVALKAFRNVADRLQVLERGLATKFRDKEIRPAQGHGLIATNEKGVQIPLTALSSGEQHEVVLFYELLFLAPDGTLVLIDEPEISLHILWQREFVNDMMAMAQLAKLDVIATTHSPFIADERSDLMVPLSSGPR